MQTEQRGGGIGHRGHVQRTRPRGDEPCLERIGAVRRRRQTVDIVAAQRREPCVESGCGAGDVPHPDILGQHPGETAHQRPELGFTGTHRPRIGVRHHGRRNVGVGDLAGGMHPCVGTSRSPGHDRHPEDRRQGLVEHSGHRALPGLRRPAGEVRSVVGDVETETRLRTRGGKRSPRTRGGERNKPATGVDGGLVHSGIARTSCHPRRLPRRPLPSRRPRPRKPVPPRWRRPRP